MPAKVPKGIIRAAAPVRYASSALPRQDHNPRGKGATCYGKILLGLDLARFVNTDARQDKQVDEYSNQIDHLYSIAYLGIRIYMVPQALIHKLLYEIFGR
jgi:hypothetical protein